MKHSEKSDKTLLNRAYGCFAFLGLITLPFGLGAVLQAYGLMNFDEGSGGVGETLTGLAYLVGMVLGFPIAAGMLTATVYGMTKTVQLRHWGLKVLSIVSIVCGGGLLLVLFNEWDEYPGWPFLRHLMDIAGGTYVAANTIIPGWWFTLGRRRYRSTTQDHEPSHQMPVG
jgi:hypothetical protein